MASRLPALDSAMRWLAQSEEFFSFLSGKRAKSWRPHFRSVSRHPILFDGGSAAAGLEGPRVVELAWRDCKGLTTASEGQRTMVGYVAGVRANLETGQGGPEVFIVGCSLAGDHGVQLFAVPRWCSEFRLTDW